MNNSTIVDYTDTRVQGVTFKVPFIEVTGRRVIVTGRWLRLAGVQDEDWQEGEVVSAPDEFITNLRRHRELGADLFTFSQKPTDPEPRFPFFYERESVAAIPLLSFSDWWTNRVSTDLRCDVRKAAKRGLVVRPVSFNDDFVRGIVEIYDETPVRQGRAFWHYRKSFDAVKLETGTYAERSDFLGAFIDDELVGFLKVVYVDRIGRLMQIIAKEAHRDKRPLNALIAKTVEICAAKGCSHLTYGRYRYSQQGDSLAAFKRRNGFEELLVPRYYVPLTMKGRLALSLQLHRGAKALVPDPIRRSYKRIRASVYAFALDRRRTA